MGECNPACMKIIINTGLVAHSTELLIASLGADDPLMAPARRLHAAASALLGSYQWLRSMNALADKANMTPDAWHGCGEAEVVVQIIEGRNATNFSVKNAIATLDSLRVNIVRALLALVSGGAL